MKQETAVLAALEEYGELTSNEIAAVVDLSVAKVSAYLCALFDDGLVERDERVVRYPAYDGSMRGGASHRWRKAKRRPALHPVWDR